MLKDFGVWVSGEYETELFKDFELEVEQEFRFEDNSRQLGRMHTNIGLEYKLAYPLRIGANYRFILNRRDNDLFGHRHRGTVDLTFRHRMRQWRFSYRARMQWEVRGWNYTNETGLVPSRKFRNKFELQYQIDRRLAAFVDVNIRVLAFDPNEPGYSGINRYRYRAGIEWLTAEYRTVTLFFLHDRDINVVSPAHEYVVGVSFGFENWKPLFSS